MTVKIGQRSWRNSQRVVHSKLFNTALSPFRLTDSSHSVTAVGATMNFNPEVAANDTIDFSEPFFSGGGFSNYFTAPSYQAATVAKYIKSLNGEHNDLFN